ncbi:MAG: trigger factor [Acidiferrobacterales bacterium]
MQVSVENMGTLGRRMTVAVPADWFEQAFANRLQRLSKQAKVPGFRPGKVPIKVIEARFGGQAMEDVAGELIQSTFRDAIGQQGLRPVGGPHIKREPVERGKEFAYTAEFEVYPAITKLDLTDQTLERPTCSIIDEDVERSVESLRRQRVTWQPVQREAHEGDRLTIDFTGTVDGETFEGGEANNLHVVLGTSGLMEGFETGLIGAKSGETRTLDLQFPATLPKQELAGKPVKFNVTVGEVAEPILPEVNETFARGFGIKDGSVETLRAHVRANLEREMAERLRTVVRGRVLEALAKANTFELPSMLLSAEVEYVRRAHQAMRGADPTSRPETPEESAAYEEAARRRLARSLMVAEVIRVNEIKAEPDKVRAHIVEMAQEYESPEEFVRACYATPARLSEIEAAVAEEQALEYLLQTAKVIDTPMSFQALVSLRAGSS